MYAEIIAGSILYSLFFEPAWRYEYMVPVPTNTVGTSTDDNRYSNGQWFCVDWFIKGTVSRKITGVKSGINR